MNVRRVPSANVLIKRRRVSKHLPHRDDFSSIPLTDVLVKRNTIAEHSFHGCDLQSVPRSNLAVKRRMRFKRVEHLGHFARAPNTHRSVTRRTPIRRALTLNGGFLKTLLNGVHESGIIIRWKWFAIVPAFQRIRRIAPNVRMFIWISAKVVVANQSVRVRVRVFRAPIHARVPIFRLRLTPNVIDAPSSRNCFVARIFNRNLRARL